MEEKNSSIDSIKIELKELIHTLDQIKLETLNPEELTQIAKLLKIEELKKELAGRIKIEKTDMEAKVEAFLNQKAKSKKTRWRYESAINYYLDYLEKENIHPLSVTAYDVDRFISFLDTEKISAVTKRVMVDSVSSFYSTLVRWQDVDHNYFKGAKKPAPVRSKDFHIPQAHDIDYIKAAYRKDLEREGTGSAGRKKAAQKMLVYIELLESAGIRIGALPTLKIRRDGSFTGFSKGKPIEGRLNPELHRKIREEKITFENLKVNTIQANLNRKLKSLYGDLRFSCHSFRHAFAVKNYTADKDIYDLKEKLGHSSILVTEKYLKGIKLLKR